MTREISEVALVLEPLKGGEYDESDIDILDAEALEGIQDDAPHLVFLIPGIRTNGWWAQEARMQELLWDGREVHFVPVRGNGGSTDRLSSWHLVSRLGLQGFRKSYALQISTLASKKNYASINVFAHSMGSALFADIIGTAARDLPKKKFDTVAFLGSVCHRRHAKTLNENAELFVNDVGTRDYFPFIASIIRPESYSDVGFVGFLNAFAHDRFFEHDHTNCTSLEHIKDGLVPLISTAEVRPLGSRKVSPRFFNVFVYVRRVIWIFPVVLLLFLLWNALF